MVNRRDPARAAVNLRHLRIFVAVVDQGSFTQAADQLFLTQSSLTTTVQQLEAELGLRLFERTTRKVTPTSVALDLAEDARRLLRGFDALVLDAWAMAEGTHGHLRLAVAPSAMVWLVAPTAQHFRALHPRITLSIRDSGSTDVVKRVLEGDVDFGLTSVEVRNPELDYKMLFRDRFGVACSADHPLALQQGPVKWSSLRQYHGSMVGLSGDTQVGQAINAAMRRMGLDTPPEEVSSSSGLFAMLSSGQRFAIVPALTASTLGLEVRPFIPLIEPVFHRDNVLVTRRLRALSPSAASLLESLTETLKQRELPPHVELALEEE